VVKALLPYAKAGMLTPELTAAVLPVGLGGGRCPDGTGWMVTWNTGPAGPVNPTAAVEPVTLEDLPLKDADGDHSDELDAALGMRMGGQ
jgi:hypothetical protein